MLKILLLTNDADLASGVSNWFEHELYSVRVLADGTSALAELQSQRYEVLLLDTVSPGIGGIDLCTRLRACSNGTLIIALNAQSSPRARETFLDAGADDCLSILFELSELSSRLRSLLRRSGTRSGRILQLEDIVLNVEEYTVTRAGISVQLDPTEFALLELLMRHPRRIFSAQALYDRIWKDKSGSLETVRTHIKTLRKKLATNGTNSLIETVRTRGYKFQPA
jgi:DNA-binding response OmpR family regulator